MNVADVASDKSVRSTADTTEPGRLIRRGEPLMVYLTASRSAPDLLRAGAEAAGRLQTSWYAVYVEASGKPVDAGTRQDASELRASVTLAETCGAAVVRVTAGDPVEGLIAFARREAISHVIFGASADSRSADLSASVRDRFLSKMNSVTVYQMQAGGLVAVFPAAAESPGGYRRPGPWLWIWVALFGVLVASRAPAILWLAAAVVLAVLWCRSLEGL